MTKHFLAGAILLFAYSNSGSSQTLIDIDEDMMKATVKIQSGPNIGSGFILVDPVRGLTNGGSFVLVTAAHVFADMPSTNVSLSLRTAGQDVYTRCPHEIQIRAHGTNLWTQHPSADVAVLRIGVPSIADTGRLGRGMLATEN